MKREFFSKQSKAKTKRQKGQKIEKKTLPNKVARKIIVIDEEFPIQIVKIVTGRNIR